MKANSITSGYKQIPCPPDCELCRIGAGHVSVDKIELSEQDMRGRASNPALMLALEIERHCPCGARPESMRTHPHVGGCPVDKLIRLLRKESR